MTVKDATRQAYETMLGRELSDADYEQVRDDLTSFFAVLIEIDNDLRHSPDQP